MRGGGGETGGGGGGRGKEVSGRRGRGAGRKQGRVSQNWRKGVGVTEDEEGAGRAITLLTQGREGRTK